MADLGFNALVNNIESALNLRCHSFEFDIIIRLYELPSAQAGDLWGLTHASSSTFYAALRKLADLGMVDLIADNADRRIRRYRLADNIRDKLDVHHASLPQWFAAKLDNGETPHFSFQQFVRGVEQTLGLHCLSCDYELVIYLFDCGPTSTPDLHAICRASRSKFHTSLRKLNANGVIITHKVPDDRRKKVHDLTPSTRSMMAKQFAQMQLWWQSWLRTRPQN
ncbi:MarR family winged helix-turn-helix transcriptional regulator [Aquisediminimonas sediminicola]|uniref:MarR family winged helix-turn-helix transcriptional regulator n=1 Tax=Alteraquisediminimonas sediminicola TaxID=2676787 RepID=UPI001C8EE278|nr:MarR family winged helix-turn-helix transcriptional regulator [Aquisediminimonas sediminicola]